VVVKMIDVTTTLNWFDRFHEKHKAECRVLTLDVSMERTSDSSTRIVLRCPTCGDNISGSFPDTDMWQVIQLLDAKKGGN
jgi:hypothetical protein